MKILIILIIKIYIFIILINIYISIFLPLSIINIIIFILIIIHLIMIYIFLIIILVILLILFIFLIIHIKKNIFHFVQKNHQYAKNTKIERWYQCRNFHQNWQDITKKTNSNNFLYSTTWIQDFLHSIR